jgi:predicted transcriptional regulator
MALSVKLDDETTERLRKLAASRERTPHWLMREAIRQYVEREEARQSFQQEALASWSHYQETGLHLTGQETKEWLSTWGTDDETEAPGCHE